MKLTIAEARRYLETIALCAGYASHEAAIIADHLLDCELRGLAFGGFSRMASILERLGDEAPASRPITILTEGPSSAAIDGADHVGYLVGARATEIAIEKARNTGICVIGAKQTWYTGMFSYYLEKITAAGFVGMVAGSGPPMVAPAGGTEARFATNPIAFGFPTTSQPIIFDIGTSGVMLGELHLKKRLGELLDPGLAFDADGNPTRDPAAALDGGAMTVWGGHKGSGLALVVQLLGVLAGAASAPEMLRDCGFFLMALDPEILAGKDYFTTEATRFATSMRATRPIDPAKPVRMPFERSAAERNTRLSEGTVSVDEEIYAYLEHFRSKRP